MLEEQIPKYKIRADSLTQFGGYENQVSQNDEPNIKLFSKVAVKKGKNCEKWNGDTMHRHHIWLKTFFIIFSFVQDWFVPSPALPIPEGGLALTKDQIRETLNYFRKYRPILIAPRDLNANAFKRQ